MRVMIELAGPDLQKSIDNGSLIAFLANATAVRWGEGQQHLPPKVDEKYDPDKVENTQRANPPQETQAEQAPQTEAPQQQAPPQAEPKPAHSLADVRALLGEKIQAGHRDAVAEILHAHGGTSLTDLPESAYDAVYEAAMKL